MQETSTNKQKKWKYSFVQSFFVLSNPNTRVFLHLVFLKNKWLKNSIFKSCFHFFLEILHSFTNPFTVSFFLGGNWSEKDKKRQKHLLLLQTAHKRWTCRLKITQTIFKKSVKKFQQQYSPQLLTTKLAIQLSLLQLIQHFREIKLLKLINHKPNARCFDKQWISNVMNHNEIAKITKECK